jgi:AcrR family transcriptional regulator
MAERMGALERRKIRTRHTLIETALRLFRDQGYENTTLAQICEGAEIGDRTFFNYFDGKDDLVFFDDRRRLDRALALFGARTPDDSVVDVLRQVVEVAMVDESTDNALALEFAPVRQRLVRENPSLQARDLQLLFETQQRLAGALREAFPDRLDEVTAAAAVGALVGAVKTAGAVALTTVIDEDEARAITRRVTDLVIAGLGSLDERQ